MEADAVQILRAASADADQVLVILEHKAVLGVAVAADAVQRLHTARGIDVANLDRIDEPTGCHLHLANACASRDDIALDGHAAFAAAETDLCFTHQMFCSF